MYTNNNQLPLTDNNLSDNDDSENDQTWHDIDSVQGHSNEQNQKVNLTKKTIATSPRSDSLNNYTLFCNKLNSIAQKNSDLSIPFGLASAFLILTCVTESPMPVIGIAALLLAITILTFLYRVCCHSEQKTDEDNFGRAEFIR